MRQAITRFTAFWPLLAIVAPLAAAAEIDFNRDIRPILSDRCFFCHGPDARNQKSDLRFDTQENAFADLGGYFAIVPGKLEKSELHRRIHSLDSDEQMPPPESNRSLSQEEIALLDEWIRQGAPYDRHWAFKIPRSPDLPNVANSTWLRNGIDNFVLQRLEQEGLAPSLEADPLTLLRRVTLDLTGLPPTPEEVDAFRADQEAHAYERAVDRLLDSPRYGERMALPWLDAARYADSAGYQNDFKRSQWPWRDWVVRAYNANMPFDQFSIEQLAGDLLENPSDEQLLATAFNRNHRINNEGGIIAEEFLVEYVADRVETTSTVWLGLTVGCARCHDHKYDPITQKEFYELFAFFHNVPEKGKDGATAPAPNMDVYTSGTRKEHERLKRQASRAAAAPTNYAKSAAPALDQWLAAEATRRSAAPGYSPLPTPQFYYTFDARRGNVEPNLGSLPHNARYLGSGRSTQNRKGRHGNGVFLRQGGYVDLGRPAGRGGFDPAQPLSIAAWVKPGPDIAGAEGPIVSCLTPNKVTRGFQINLVEIGRDEFEIAFRLHSNREAEESVEVRTVRKIPAKEFAHVTVTYDGSMKADGVVIYLNGQEVPVRVDHDSFGNAFTIQESVLLGAEKSSSSAKTIRDELLANTDLDEILLFRTVLDSQQTAFLSKAASEDVLFSIRGKRNKAASDFLASRYFGKHDPDYMKLLAAKNRAEQRLKEFEEKRITQVSIMREMEKPRDTFILQRGAYDHPDKRERLEPAPPDALLPFRENLPRNRLGLARWLFDERNPLTARVAVNRYWQMYFGVGLVKTSEDFGSQGELPSHPELLDWLATRFRDSGWDIKAMQRLIVTSATYRQSSRVTHELWERDPENRLLARGPRFRLYPQALRDQALAASGLLVDRRGGPPVMPYQPAGLWEEVSAKGFKYVEAHGSDLYRRSLYTFWRRTVPPPSMMNFDNAGREVCSVSSRVTSTPLQAMNLMNDPTFVEAARGLAQRMLIEGEGSISTRVRFGYKTLLGREPSEAVFVILKRGCAQYLEDFRHDPEAAAELIGIGESAVPSQLDPVELAAYTAVASVLLNLDETVTKE